MPDKLTDKEIVKALECCINNLCPNCPLGHHITGTYNEHCGDDLMKYALDLINRLQAEKNDLFYKLTGVMHSVDKWLDGDELKQDEVNRASAMREKTLQIVENLQAENERLKEEICIQHKIIDERGAEVLRHDRCIRTLHEKLETAKAEAYKEFAERLRSKAKKTTITYVTDTSIQEHETGWIEISLKDFDNLLKELVGEEND